MKKNITFLTMVFALIIVILSCTKNQSDSDSMNYSANQITDFHQGIEHQILSFKSNLEKPLKSGSGYLIDTAVWYTEALINYTYATVVTIIETQSPPTTY